MKYAINFISAHYISYRTEISFGINWRAREVTETPSRVYKLELVRYMYKIDYS